MSMNSFSVSICVPIYGVEHYIERCARSLFEQTYENIEYIFVDDCSPDRSMDILRRVMSDYPERIDNIHIVRHGANRGLSCARITALENCTSDFVTHVDSDDWIDKDMIELMVERQRLTNADIVTVKLLEHKVDGITESNDIFFTSGAEMAISLLRQDQFVRVCGRLYRRSLYTEHGIQPVEGINVGEDYQVSPRLAYYAKRVELVDKCLYHYYKENADSYTFSMWGELQSDKLRQELSSLDVLKSFFADKGENYLDAIFTTELRKINWYIYSCVEHKDRKFFKELVCRINNNNKHMWYLLGRHDAFSMFVKRNYYLMRLYLTFCRLRPH